MKYLYFTDVPCNVSTTPTLELYIIRLYSICLSFYNYLNIPYFSARNFQLYNNYLTEFYMRSRYLTKGAK